MSTYVEIVVPWQRGPFGFGKPVSEESVRRAVDVAFAFVRPDLVATFVEQPPAQVAALAVPRRYGQRDIHDLRESMESALMAPSILETNIVPRMWVVNGCTLSTYHPPNDAAMLDLMVTLQLPVPGNEALSRVVNEDRGGAHVVALDSGWEISVDDLTVRVWPLEPHEAADYHDLYAPDALDHPFRWVSSIGRNTAGLGTTLYASAPVVRPWGDGFLDFYAATVSSVKSWRAFAHALVHRPQQRMWPWVITRTSVFEGWVAVPRDIATASADAVVTYLSSPASRDAGWIGVRQRVMRDPDHKKMATPLNDPEHTVRVLNALATRVRGLTVTMQIAQSRAPGMEPWWWVRLSTDRRVYVDAGPTTGELTVRAKQAH